MPCGRQTGTEKGGCGALVLLERGNQRQLAKVALAGSGNAVEAISKMGFDQYDGVGCMQKSPGSCQEAPFAESTDRRIECVSQCAHTGYWKNAWAEEKL